MKHSLLLLTALLAAPLLVCGQEATRPAKSVDVAELSISLGNNEGAYALAYQRSWGVGKSRRFRIGTGLRYTGYLGQEKEFITAPASLTSKMQSPAVLFSKTYEENLDTLVLDIGYTQSVNLLINLQYNITSKLDIGFNIDAIGFSWGKRQIGDFKASSTDSRYAGTRQTAKPTTFNLLLISDNDIGSLNSELYARYHFSDRFAVKAGLTFLFSEYMADRELAFDNDRYRHKSFQAMVGFAYKPFAKHR
jgi:hypothetical protein